MAISALVRLVTMPSAGAHVGARLAAWVIIASAGGTFECDSEKEYVGGLSLFLNLSVCLSV